MYTMLPHELNLIFQLCGMYFFWPDFKVWGHCKLYFDGITLSHITCNMYWCWWLFFIPVFLSIGPTMKRVVGVGQKRIQGNNPAPLQSNTRPQITPLRSAPQLPPGSATRSSIRAPPPPSEPAPPNQPTVRLGCRPPQISKLSDFVIKYLTAWILVMRNFGGSWCMCVIRYNASLQST